MSAKTTEKQKQQEPVSPEQPAEGDRETVEESLRQHEKKDKNAESGKSRK